jgi:glycosyltransferase involved in cell wall biosynthesis
MNNNNVTVISPCRNEIDHIDSFIESLKNQLNFNETEFIIADGLSDDGTKEKLTQYSLKYKNIHVVDNPLKIVSTGLNIATKLATNEIIVRMDIHTKYDQSYILNCISCLTSSDAKCVGGPWVAKSNNLKQQAIAAVFQSKLVVGGAKSRDVNYSGEIDTVYLGCWWKKYLVEIGGFDENLVRNQDDELCMRIRNNGHKIYQDASIKSFYYPRSKFRELFKQYMQYGYWKVIVIKKYGKTASFRHLALITFFTLQIISLLLTIFIKPIMFYSLGLLSLYLIAIALLSLNITLKNTGIKLHHVFVAIFFMHFSYSCGMIYSFIFSLRYGKSLAKSMDKLSR